MFSVDVQLYQVSGGLFEFPEKKIVGKKKFFKNSDLIVSFHVNVHLIIHGN